MPHSEPFAQKPEYTSRRNVDAGRHGWLRLTSAYSVQLVEEILAPYPRSAKVIDPFGGTGTTALCAASRGNRSISCDINPFLVWLAQAKTASYSEQSISEVVRIAKRLRNDFETGQTELAPAPPIHNLSRWWTTEQLEYLCKLKGGINAMDCSKPARDLLHVAFCRTIIEVASVTRGHQSLSYSGRNQLDLFDSNYFWDALSLVLRSAKINPECRVRVICGDSRRLSNIRDGSVDIVITSPPYPNRVTAIRELRPYMYWLDFVHSTKEVGELDWLAIGGTWGNATHRLGAWNPSATTYFPNVIRSVFERIRRVKVESASLLANFVLRYFEDIYTHMLEMRRIVAVGGQLHYVIGNSSFYEQVVESEKAYVNILQELGFRNARARMLRKRNSKRELYEYVVSAERS